MAELAKIERSTRGLMETMFDELDNLRSGKTTPQKACAAARITQQIVSTAKLQLDYLRFVEGKAQGDDLKTIPNLQLVASQPA